MNGKTTRPDVDVVDFMGFMTINMDIGK